MANKRIFKKNVNKLTSALINDMMTASVVFDGSDKEAVDNAVINLIKGSEAAVVKANVKFDKGVKAFESQALYSKAKAKFFHDVFKKTQEGIQRVCREIHIHIQRRIPRRAQEKSEKRDC